MPKALPPPPTNAAETRALLAAEVCKTTPDISKLKALQTLLTSFEEEDRRKADAITKTADDALREKEVEASLKASTEWREAQTILIRKEVTDEVDLAYRCKTLGESQTIARLQAENKTLQDKISTLRVEAGKQGDEITSLRSELSTTKENLSVVTADRDELQARSDVISKHLAEVTPPETQEEYAKRIDDDVQRMLAAPPLTLEEQQRQAKETIELIARIETRQRLEEEKLHKDDWRREEEERQLREVEKRRLEDEKERLLREDKAQRFRDRTGVK
jgi:hypothetical protein